MNKEVEAGAGAAIPEAGRQAGTAASALKWRTHRAWHTAGSVETVQAEQVEQLGKPVMRAVGISSDS